MWKKQLYSINNRSDRGQKKKLTYLFKMSVWRDLWQLRVSSLCPELRAEQETALHGDFCVHSAVLFNNDFMFPKADLLHHYAVRSSILHCYFKATLYFQTYLSIHRPELGYRPPVHESNQPWSSMPRAHFHRNPRLLAIYQQNMETWKHTFSLCSLIRPLSA